MSEPTTAEVELSEGLKPSSTGRDGASVRGEEIGGHASSAYGRQ
jgi:hypothetical protein